MHPHYRYRALISFLFISLSLYATTTSSGSHSEALLSTEGDNVPTLETNASINPYCRTPIYPQYVEDLIHFPQEIENYADKNIQNHRNYYAIQKAFAKNYFSVWKLKRPPEKVYYAKWPFRSYVQGKMYGENLQLLDEAWFDNIKKEANFGQFGKVSRYGMTLHFASLRNFPTHKPLFRDPTHAGEGFPFDYLQNSAVHANEPVFISHYSKDGAWTYVYTSYASGWLPTYEIAYINKKERKRWMKAKPVYLLQEKVALTDTNGHFLFYSRVGMRLAFVKNRGLYTYAKAVAPGVFNKPTFVTIKFRRQDVSTKPLLLNKKNLIRITKDVMKSNYGWGGLYEERDCSSTLRDIYAPFGIWVPRNSRQQSRVGKVISLKDMNTTQKEKTIKSEGIPFETFLHRHGHIMLYLGTYEDNIMILHNMWGIKTVNENHEEGRIIVGKVVISTLDIGSEQEGYDYNSSLLPSLDRMNIFTYKAQKKKRVKRHRPKKKAL